MSAEYNAKFANTDIATRAIHAGQEPDPTTGAVVTPIFATSTFKQDGVLGLRGGHDYSRSINPTRTSFDEQLAAVEGGKYALSFSSGLAAIDVLLRSTIKPGDNILLGNDVYGGTYRLLSKVFVPWGAGLDNTFASPALQHPLADGADVVVYSTTKYIGGHSDVVGGAVVVNDEETREKVAFLQNAAGAVPSPFDSWLDIRGLKTLDLRVKRHSANALKVAEWLESQPSDVIERVWYPGLESHPGHEIAARQMHGGFGGIVSVQLAAGAEAAKHFVDHTQIFTLAESLGGVESLIEVPAAMTHASVAGTTLQVPANLVRISVGIENADDLIADLKQALDRI